MSIPRASYLATLEQGMIVSRWFLLCNGNIRIFLRWCKIYLDSGAEIDYIGIDSDKQSSFGRGARW